MVKFDTDGKHLYIDGKKVLRAWESFTGWYTGSQPRRKANR